MVAYLSYLVGDYTGLSGIVSLFCCSVTMSHYALHNITKQQRAAVLSFYETISFMSEGSIFVYVGLDALDPLKWKVSNRQHALATQHDMTFSNSCKHFACADDHVINMTSEYCTPFQSKRIRCIM